MLNVSRILLIALVLVAAALRINGLFENTFHADEALFATWAREIAVWRDPLLESQLVDKPPLLFYLQALFYPLLGPEMFAARLPNFIASLMLIPLTAKLAWRLYRSQITMLLAAAFVAFSPMAIQFSSSAFIDPLMSCLVVASLVAVVRGPVLNASQNKDVEEPGWGRLPAMGGALFGLAVISKYQAWLFIPLHIGLAAIVGWRRTEWRRWMIGFLPVFGVLVAWELLRSNELTIFETQLQSYGGLRLAWSWELWPRLQAWAFQWSHVLRSPVLEMLLLLALPLIVALLIDQHNRPAALDRLFVLFAVAYSLLMWFIAVPVWDRYVLALLPFVGLVLARVVWRVVAYVWTMLALPFRSSPWIKNSIILVPLALIFFQGAAVAAAYRGELPIGATPRADQGAAEISQALANEPYGTVLYDHWYSWQWRYHLFASKVYVSWFPDPDGLVDDLQVFGKDGHQRFIALPDSRLSMPVKRALTESGFSLKHVVSAQGKEGEAGISLYLIETGP
jgi:4-amino-4-deoxy-L-arabinose transferase-like glycosyltransferase